VGELVQSRPRESIEDDPRSGRSVTATSPTEIELIKRLIEEDRFITYDQMEEQSSLSHGTINRMIHDHLGLRKLASRWVPHQLSVKNRQDRLNFCKEMLGRIESGQVRLDQIVTGDECWIYFRQIAKRASSRAWTAPGQAPPTIVKREEMHVCCVLPNDRARPSALFGERQDHRSPILYR